MLRIAVFASGSGTNAGNLIRYFKSHRYITISNILTNKHNAGVIERAVAAGVPCNVFSAKDFRESQVVEKFLTANGIGFIVLAGFLLLIPPSLISAYRRRIVNIHPALLPAHGGKGFYGMRVHESVINSGAVMSGITVHEVDERFDEGDVIFQAACHIDRNDDAASLAQKIHELEYKWYPVVIEKYIGSLNLLS